MRLGCCAARCETGTAAARCVWDAALLDENKKKNGTDAEMGGAASKKTIL